MWNMNQRGQYSFGMLFVVGMLIIGYYVVLMIALPIFDLMFPLLLTNGGIYGTIAVTLFQLTLYLVVPMLILFIPYMAVQRRDYPPSY